MLLQMLDRLQGLPVLGLGDAEPVVDADLPFGSKGLDGGSYSVLMLL